MFAKIRLEKAKQNRMHKLKEICEQQAKFIVGLRNETAIKIEIEMHVLCVFFYRFHRIRCKSRDYFSSLSQVCFPLFLIYSWRLGERVQFETKLQSNIHMFNWIPKRITISTIIWLLLLPIDWEKWFRQFDGKLHHRPF